jgi:pimeloyl-ACP methyl ester carboxylesterase
MTETFVPSGRLRLWTERTGDPTHPAVLLIMGAGAQGITCPDALVARLVAHGRQVIRFDHRDTGRSSTVDFELDPYTIADLAGDCLAVLDAYELTDAHLAGASLGGCVAQWLAVHEPTRVRSLTLLSTTPTDRDPDTVALPTARFRDYLAARPNLAPGPEADLALFRVYHGDVLDFDEPAARAMLDRAWSRAVDPAAAAHHHRAARQVAPELLGPITKITAPTTIVHGDQDPVLTLAHADALAADIPHARLEIIPGLGHGMFSPGLPERLADLIATG